MQQLAYFTDILQQVLAPNKLQGGRATDQCDLIAPERAGMGAGLPLVILLQIDQQ
ncbi:hypothetical protein D3C87_1816500 [compost metagenome]